MPQYSPETEALLDELRPPVDPANDLRLVESVSISAIEPGAADKMARLVAARAEIQAHVTAPTQERYSEPEAPAAAPEDGYPMPSATPHTDSFLMPAAEAPASGELPPSEELPQE